MSEFKTPATCAECEQKFDLGDPARPKRLQYFHCSDYCHERWWRGRMVFLIIRIMKNMSLWTFKEFNDCFQFDEAGGYAEEKYRIAKLNTPAFLFSLSKDKIVLFSRCPAMGANEGMYK